MQIGDATQSTSAGLASRGGAISVRSDVDSTQLAQSSQKPESASDRVTISSAALRAQQNDVGSATEDHSDDSVDDNDQPSLAKSFVYGCFRLDRPQPDSQSKPTDGYDYGRWIATAVTVGAVISVLV
ncbi:hypothetical protein FHW67_000089 [Herbaspirillum sp. Sphag1AN]|uniref:hypothetical protein n=1 Tax=unclassified Herbaspirillum TaxID=2624150 RepID=UPI001612323A|nr:MULTISPECIES: hypothetical protein [unclassified Herbaspirillum]MBB3210854.1 hypothetical protein [Herbaspirillum sp. Sphag1AN]MBB3244484.1 hypothetical protein [Herbaspirillum sp. Sphag64]